MPPGAPPRHENAPETASGCGMLLGEMACRVVGVILALRARR
jgi:hypothetical protein